MNVSRHNTLSRTLALPLCARARSLSLSDRQRLPCPQTEREREIWRGKEEKGLFAEKNRLLRCCVKCLCGLVAGVGGCFVDKQWREGGGGGGEGEGQNKN